MPQRDMRDQEKLGQMLLSLRRLCPEAPLSCLADELPTYYVPDYEAGPYMSADPHLHHSKVDQTLGDLTE